MRSSGRLDFEAIKLLRVAAELSARQVKVTNKSLAAECYEVWCEGGCERGVSGVEREWGAVIERSVRGV